MNSIIIGLNIFEKIEYILYIASSWIKVELKIVNYSRWSCEIYYYIIFIKIYLIINYMAINFILK